MINRRGMILGLLATPVIVKASSLMPIRNPIIPAYPEAWLPCDGRQLLTRQYRKLAEIINDNLYGNNALPTYFNLPDLRGRSYISTITDSEYTYQIATGEGPAQFMPIGGTVLMRQDAIDFVQRAWS